MWKPLLCWIGAALLLSPVPAGAQTHRARAIAVSGVPGSLTLPLASERNLVLTAEVAGEPPPLMVWIATEPAGPMIPMTPAGTGRWQINLAEPPVGRVLVGSGVARSDAFRVYALFADGERVASVPVAFGRPAVDAQEVGLRIVGSNGLSEPVDPGHWYKPQEVAAIEARAGGAALEGHLRVGSDRWVMVAGAGGVLGRDLDAALRERWLRRGTLEVWVVDGGAPRRAVTLRARPGRLRLDAEGARFEVRQRRRSALPGSAGFVLVELGDITGGGVQVAVRTRAGDILVGPRRLGEGERVALHYGGERFTIEVERLVNHLLGKDKAALRLERVGGAPDGGVRPAGGSDAGQPAAEGAQGVGR
jgi:hypothetical protein